MSTAPRDVVPQPSQRFRHEEADGELILYDTLNHDVMYLDATAALVWQLIDGARSLDDIVGLLGDAYPEARDAIARDVPQTVAMLADAGALELMPTGDE